MDWNNGTIFRVFVNSGTQSVIDCKVDIAQQDLNNTVFIGIENWFLRPDPTRSEFWFEMDYVQMESVQLTPYIDYSSQISEDADILEPGFNDRNSRNTSIFARLPMIRSPGAIHDGNEVAMFAGDRVLNKDSILYEMRNNPNALANGRLRIRLLDEYGTQIPDGNIEAFSFTLVIYKPSNNYN